jgi:sulfonate transport system ATP-binding protein
MTMDILDRIATPDPRVSMTGALVTLQGVTKDFGVHRVLRGIDLTIQPGQFVAVVGRSGCGK